MLEQVVFLVPGFPADEADTSCVPAVQNYVRAFARCKPEIDVRVLAFQYPPGRTRYGWHGIPVFAAGGSNRGGMRKLSTWARVWRAHEGGSRAVIHSFWIGECALLGELFARVHGGAHVATIGGQELRKPTIYSRLLSRGRFTLTAGSRLASDTAVKTLGRAADFVIPLGIDSEHFIPAGLPRDIDVLAVGSLIDVKRFREVVRAAERLPHRRFVLAGDGPLRETLHRRAPANIELVGHLSREAVLDLMQRSKVLLHPSEFESQGYVFLEALASGMYVVCRNVGDPGRTDKVHRCSSFEEMCERVEILLTTAGDFSPRQVSTAEETVHAFEEVYEMALRRSAP